MLKPNMHSLPDASSPSPNADDGDIEELVQTDSPADTQTILPPPSHTLAYPNPLRRLTNLAETLRIPRFYILALTSILVLLTARSVLVGLLSLVDGALACVGLAMVIKAVMDIEEWIDRRVVLLKGIIQKQSETGTVRRERTEAQEIGLGVSGGDRDGLNLARFPGSQDIPAVQ
ncbi:MAG: hypothetical protein M1828_001208 [Chrysothrix sp. TS-e1954]|nr:MAG: hypothetical protein M1828_001208 [Chrysothrix sp. TS-e1954]